LHRIHYNDISELRGDVVDAFSIFQKDNPDLDDLLLAYIESEGNRSKNNEFFLALSDDLKTQLGESNGIGATTLWEFLFKREKTNFGTSTIKILKKYSKKGLRLEQVIAEENGTVQAVQELENSESIVFEEPNDDDTNSRYFKSIQDRFEFIDFTIIDFKIPITEIAKLPLLKRDIVLEKKLERLEQELNNVNKKELPEQWEELYTKISSIQKELSKKNDLQNLISDGKDIFIEAPAGTGKSTALKWLAYDLSSDAENKLVPVFIELKYFRKSLGELILDHLDKYHNVKSLKELGTQFLLLLDGFDELPKNSDIDRLFFDLKSLKSKYQLQFIFCGRQLPNTSKHKLDVLTFTLSKLSVENIKAIFQSYLGEDLGIHRFQMLQDRGLLSQLYRPLYLSLLLTLFKRSQNSALLDESHLGELLRSKGRLMQELLIENFLKEYEQKHTNLLPNLWKSDKIKELNILNLLAYLITVEKVSNDVIDIDVAIGLIIAHENSPINNPQEIETILNGFVMHGFVERYENQISFFKKEIRLFFASRYLSGQINNAKDFESFKKDIQTKKTKLNDPWTSISEFLFGILPPDKILDYDLFKKADDKVFPFSNSSFKQFEYAVRFLDQNNYPNIHKTIFTPENLLSIVDDAFANYIAFKKKWRFGVNGNPLSELLALLPYYKLSHFSKRIDFFSKSLLIKINNRFFRYRELLIGNARWIELARIVQRYRMGISFDKILETTMMIDYYAGKNSIENIVSISDGHLPPSQEETLDILYYVFRRNSELKGYRWLLKQSWGAEYQTRRFIKRSFPALKYKLIERILDDKLPLNFITTFRFYKFQKKYYPSNFELNIEEFSQPHQNFIIEKIVSAIVDFEKRNINLIHFLSRFLHEGINKEATQTIINTLKADFILNKDTLDFKRQNAIYMLFAVGGESDETFLKELLVNQKFNKPIIDCLMNYRLATKGQFNLNGTDVCELLLFYLKLKTTDDKERERFMLRTLRASPNQNEYVITLFKDDSVNIDRTAFLDYFYFFRVKKAIPLVKKLLVNDKHSHVAYYTLSLLDPSLFNFYKVEFEDATELLKQKLEVCVKANDISSLTITEIENLAFLGDTTFLKKMETIDIIDIYEDKRNFYFKQAKDRLEEKMKIIHENEV
jgi:hypothetical protein